VTIETILKYSNIEKTIINLLTIFVLGLSNASDLPSFSWHSSERSTDGIPNLVINFPDGISHDVVLLKKMFPELESSRDSGDDCIYHGYLQHESGVYVTMTGGCPFEDTFEVNHYLSMSFFLSFFHSFFLSFFLSSFLLNIIFLFRNNNH